VELRTLFKKFKSSLGTAVANFTPTVILP